MDYFVPVSTAATRSMEVLTNDLSTSVQVTIEQMFRQMKLADGVLGPSTTMRETSSSSDRASIFSLHFLGEIDEHESSDPIKGFFDGAAHEDDYRHELDLLVMT